MRKFKYIGVMPEVTVFGAGQFRRNGPAVGVPPAIASLLAGDPNFREEIKEVKTKAVKAETIEPEPEKAPVKSQKTGGK